MKRRYLPTFRHLLALPLMASGFAAMLAVEAAEPDPAPYALFVDDYMMRLAESQVDSAAMPLLEACGVVKGGTHFSIGVGAHGHEVAFHAKGLADWVAGKGTLEQGCPVSTGGEQVKRFAASLACLPLIYRLPLPQREER
jgi:hypothetical protein